MKERNLIPSMRLARFALPVKALKGALPIKFQGTITHVRYRFISLPGESC